MRSQINLFDASEGEPRSVPFSAVAIFSVVAVLLTGCLCMGLASRYRMRDIESEAKKIGALRSKLSTQYAALNKIDSAGNIPDGESEKLMAERDALSAAAVTLKSVEYTDRGGFSQYLQALSRRTPPGVSVDVYEMGRGRGKVAMSGKAASPDLLATFILTLQSEPLLKRQTFSRMEMRPSSEAPNAPYIFELATSGAK